MMTTPYRAKYVKKTPPVVRRRSPFLHCPYVPDIEAEVIAAQNASYGASRRSKAAARAVAGREVG